MNDPNPVPTTPWYQSPQFVSIVTLVVTQLLAWVARKYNINFSAFGVTADSAVQFVLNGISFVAAIVAASLHKTPPVQKLVKALVKKG